MTENNFKMLSDEDHIRLRSGMYVGSVTPEPHILDDGSTVTVTPGLIKIVSEIIDNSVDERVRTKGKHANIVKVDIQDDGVIHITDNGRGIPNVKHDGIYQAELAWTRPRAGSNFDDMERLGIGMNGVGSFLTKVLSTNFMGVSDDGKKCVTVFCRDGGPPMTKASASSGKTGVKVTFYPDYPFFSQTKFDESHIAVIRDRLTNLACCYPGMKFMLNGEAIQFKNHEEIVANYGLGFEYESVKNILIVVGSSGSADEFRHKTYLNGLNLKNGGANVDYILEQIIERIRPVIKKRHKIDVTPAYIKQGLFLASFASDFPQPKFDSQTKERLTNKRADVAPFYEKINFDKLAKKILENDIIIKPLVELMLAKQERAEAKEVAEEQAKMKKKRVVNHVAATHPDPSMRTLFISEGASAAGNLLVVRDPQLHGGYALRGKVMNVRGMKNSEIVSNKEYSELMAILGLQFNKPAEKLEYGRIALMADQDQDGKSIICLLVNFFSLWPDLLESGRVVRAGTPIRILKKGKQVKRFYHEDEYLKQAHLFDNSWNMEYLKGLGSLTEEEYALHIHNPVFTPIIRMNHYDDDALEMAFGNNSDRRKDWLMNP